MLVVGKEGANAAVEAPLGCVRVECCCLLDVPGTTIVREEGAADGGDGGSGWAKAET